MQIGGQKFQCKQIEGGVKFQCKPLEGPIKGGLSVGCRLEFFGNVQCQLGNKCRAEMECPVSG